MDYPRKPPLQSILVFGASAHIGGPLADYIVRHASHVKLRLASSVEEKCGELRARFPSAEVVYANYYDLPSMERALDGMEGCYVLTPDFLDEHVAMSVLNLAAKHTGALRHMVRICADPPGLTLARVPAKMHEYGGGTAVQHIKAKALLEQFDLPITFINHAGWYFDNLLSWLAKPILAKRKLVMAWDRKVLHVDPAELGEGAARILLSDDARYIGQFLQFDNGQDFLAWSEIAAMMSEEFGVPIAYDGTPEGFVDELGPGIRAYWSRVGVFARKGIDPTDYFLNYFRLIEFDNEPAWRRTDTLERVLGRRPKTMRQWLKEHREFFVRGMGLES
ncbi:NmrA family NAD(P)-binding protein [Aromatoleum toluclasticum]|uniref:NmrA family NAD(P)-binding protein n=1 Tax=Aromatoleum toluclasticum TaxID=92003 RepID=UPI00035E6EE8|nr:NmrA family NAD(P)-binding protein [Aromatoleum toluclasticum]